MTTEPAPPPVDAKGSLTRQTMIGVRWMYMGTVAQFTLQLGYQVFINRLLSPRAFGLMAIGLLVQRFGNYFSKMGVEQAIIQKPELSQRDTRTAFTLSMFLGLLALAVVWVSAPAIGDFFKGRASNATSAEAAAIIRAMAFAFVLAAAGMTAQGLLKRQLRFRELAIRDTVAYVVGFPIVGLTMAALGAGVWSLVGAVLTGVAMATTLAYLAVRHSLVPLLNPGSVRQLFNYGTRNTLISVLEWLGGNLDTMAVGRFTSIALLGQYNRAYFLTNYPMSKLAQNLSQVLFSGFSRIQSDLERLRRVYLTATRIAAYLLLPICAGLAVASREVVLVVLGSQWEAAIPLLPFMSAAIAFSLMTHFAGVTMGAMAKLNMKLALQLGSIVVLGLFLLMAQGHGLWAFAAALAASQGVRNVGYAIMMRSVLGVSMRATWQAYLPGLLTAALTGALIGAISAGAQAMEMPQVLILAIDGCVGVLVLALGLRLPFNRRIRREIRSRLGEAGMMRTSGRLGQLSKLILGAPSLTNS